MKSKYFAASAFTLGLITLGACATASAQSGTASTPAISAPAISMLSSTAEHLKAQPKGVYDIEPNHTTVVWRATHMGISNYTARFEKASGTINFDPENVTNSSVNVAIDASSVSTGLPNFNTEIAAQAFNVAQHPTINFQSTSLVQTGPTSGNLTGNLTFNGQTKPVTLQVVFNGAIVHPFARRAALGFSARGSINRSEFGVTKWAPFVGDKVELMIEVEAIKKAD